MAIQAISYSDIHAFQRLYDIHLHPWQVEAIEQVDGIWLAQHG